MGAFDSILAGGKNAYGLLTTTGVVNVSASLPPTVGQVLTANSSSDATWQDASSGGTPGGADTQLQFNDAGVFGGAPGVLYDKVANSFQVTGEFLSPGAGAGSFKIGLAATAGGINSFTLGNNSSNSGAELVVIGNNVAPDSFTSDSVLIGNNIASIGFITSYSSFNTVIGNNASISGTSPGVTNSIAIGYGASIKKNGSATVDGAICLGTNSLASGSNQIIIGNNISGDTDAINSILISSFAGLVSGSDSVRIGVSSSSPSLIKDVTIGVSAIAGSYGVGVGYGAVLGAFDTVLGYMAKGGGSGVAIGYSSWANGTYSVSVGYDSYGVNGGVGIGYKAYAYGSSPYNTTSSISIGYNAGGAYSYSKSCINLGADTSTGTASFIYSRSTAIMYGASTRANDAVAFGYQSSVQHNQSWALGYQSVSTDANQFNIGSSVQPLKVVSYKDYEIADILNNDSTSVEPGDVVVMSGNLGFVKSTLANESVVMVVARSGVSTSKTEVINSGIGHVYIEPNTIVAVGDIIVASGVTIATAKIDNTETDHSKIIGYCWENKTTGVVRELTTFYK